MAVLSASLMGLLMGFLMGLDFQNADRSLTHEAGENKEKRYNG